MVFHTDFKKIKNKFRRRFCIISRSIFKQLICDTDHVTPLYRCSSTKVKDGSHDHLVLPKVHANLTVLPLKHYLY